MLNKINFANALYKAFGSTEGPNGPTPTSNEALKYAEGIIEVLKAGTVSHSSGEVTGQTTAGAPLTNGATTGGEGDFTPQKLISLTSGSFSPLGPLLSVENEAIVEYLTDSIEIEFPAGTITGICGSTATSPGPLVNGAGSGGKVAGLSGADAADFVAAQTGMSGPDMVTFYTALVNYIMENAEVSYLAGTVTGTCPAVAGPLSNGAASGGKIT